MNIKDPSVHAMAKELALSKALDAPQLFKGEDFRCTDGECVLWGRQCLAGGL